MSTIAIPNETLPRTGVAATLPAPAPLADADRKPLTKKETAADHPTWCPGCGDFSVLALYYKLIEKRKIWHEKICTVAGIGCSSRFPYFVQAHGAHFIHGRALAFASGVSLSRPDLHVFVFGGDGDAFSIGGNHFTHTARKNVKMTYVVMDNFVYGLTKKQTSPTSPLGFKSKTDIGGTHRPPDQSDEAGHRAGATFVARSTATNIPHLLKTHGGGDGSRRLLVHRVPQRVHRVFPRRVRRRDPAQRRHLPRDSRRARRDRRIRRLQAVRRPVAGIVRHFSTR